MNWSTYEGEDTADTNYGELGPAMQAFESWVELNYNSGAYSVLEFAYESDNENLAEEGCQRFGANSFMEGVADNMDNVYGQALPTWKHIKQQVASIIDPTGRYGWTWDTLIEEAEEFFCESEWIYFTEWESYED